MTKSPNAAVEALEEMLYAKVQQAMANGASEDQAIATVRSLWLESLR